MGWAPIPVENASLRVDLCLFSSVGAYNFRNPLPRRRLQVQNFLSTPNLNYWGNSRFVLARRLSASETAFGSNTEHQTTLRANVGITIVISTTELSII
jgi:hypothetical protein